MIINIYCSIFGVVIDSSPSTISLINNYMKKINPKDLEINPKVKSNGMGISQNSETTNIICTIRTYGTECNFQTLAGGCQDTQVEACPTNTVEIDCNDLDKTKSWCESVVICKETEKNCVDSLSRAPICCAPDSDNINCAGSFKYCESREYCPVSDDCTSNGEIQCNCNDTMHCALYTETCEKTHDTCHVDVATKINDDCDTI